MDRVPLRKRRLKMNFRALKAQWLALGGKL
jgi:hypothetical protein